MNTVAVGVTMGKDVLVGIGNGDRPIGLFQARRLSDALLIAAIVSASIEIDEITKQDNTIHE